MNSAAAAIAVAVAAASERRSVTDVPRIIAPSDRPIVGRTPLSYKITPSKSQPWYGTVTGAFVRTTIAIVGGDRFTQQQMFALEDRGIDPVEVESITVRREASMEEIWVGFRSYSPVLGMECPVLTRRGDGKIKVIAPSGELKWVRPDGWAHKPTRNPGQSEWGY